MRQQNNPSRRCRVLLLVVSVLAANANAAIVAPLGL